MRNYDNTFERNLMKQWEYIAGTSIAFALIYNITNTEIKLNQNKDKPLNNIEAILITEDHLKRISNPGIKIKDTDRSDSKKISDKKYNKFTKQINHHNRKMNMITKVNEYSQNNTSQKYFPNDRRKVERYTLINY